MIKTVSMTLLALAMASTTFAVTPVFAQRIIGGVGAPQAVNCSNHGGTMNGSMCDLPSGNSCEAMTWARDGQCFDAAGNLVPEEALEPPEKEVDATGDQPASPGDPTTGNNENGGAATPTQ